MESIGNGPFLSTPDAVTLRDVTYDGYKDLVVLASMYNFSHDYYPYDPKTGMYATSPLVAAANPTIDEKALTITSQTLTTINGSR